LSDWTLFVRADVRRVKLIRVDTNAPPATAAALLEAVGVDALYAVLPFNCETGRQPFPTAPNYRRTTGGTAAVGPGNFRAATASPD
jgi:hypothetical protein